VLERLDLLLDRLCQNEDGRTHVAPSLGPLRGGANLRNDRVAFHVETGRGCPRRVEVSYTGSAGSHVARLRVDEVDLDLLRDAVRPVVNEGDAPVSPRRDALLDEAHVVPVGRERDL